MLDEVYIVKDLGIESLDIYFFGRFPPIVGSGCSWLRVRFGAAHLGYRLTITIPNAKFRMARKVTLLHTHQINFCCVCFEYSKNSDCPVACQLPILGDFNGLKIILKVIMY